MIEHPQPNVGALGQEFPIWIQSFYRANLELFDRAIDEFGEPAVEAHLPQLADWAAHRVRHEIPEHVLHAFVHAAGEVRDLETLREGARGNREWERILEILVQEGPEYLDAEILPKYGQSAHEIGATPGSGRSR